MQEEIRFTGNTQETIRFTIGKYQFTAANGEVKRDVVP
jgi:hypothetical protein